MKVLPWFTIVPHGPIFGTKFVIFILYNPLKAQMSIFGYFIHQCFFRRCRTVHRQSTVWSSTSQLNSRLCVQFPETWNIGLHFHPYRQVCEVPFVHPVNISSKSNDYFLKNCIFFFNFYYFVEKLLVLWLKL